MKNLLIAAMAAAAIFTSCKKEASIETPQDISITFTNDQTTKAFFDPTTTAERWESDLSALTVLIFDGGGKLLSQRIFDEAEITAMSANFAIPNTAAGTSCEFFAVANIAVPASVMNKANLMDMLENDPTVYNSTFAQASSQSVRSGGFVMSGSAVKVISATGGRTNIAITLNRTVAKVAVKSTTTAKFASHYHGKVRVDNATISLAANQSAVIAPPTTNAGARNYTYTQAPAISGALYQNLFYMFSNDAVGAGNRMSLRLDCTYDRDGDYATTGDQIPVDYEIELNGSGAGDFNRNGYYRIEVLIDGLTGADASATISVAGWNAPITQSVNVGQ